MQLINVFLVKLILLLYKVLPSSRVLLVLSWLLYVLCLTQPGFYTDRDGPVLDHGFGLLILGWIALIDIEGLVWLANPVLFLAWYLEWNNKHKASLIVAVAALILMLAFTMHSQVIIDASGTLHPVTAYGLGYWVWISSAVVALLSAIVGVVVTSSDF